MSHRGVIEAGPATIRWLCCGAVQSADAAAALEWIDDPVALAAGNPVAVPELLRRLLTCPQPAESIEIIHPSWWPARRVELFAAAAATLAEDVVTRPRSAVLSARYRDAVLVEIAAELVCVTGETGIAAEPRLGAPGDVAEAVARRVPAGESGRTVVIDAPSGIGGAGALATMIQRRLPPGVRAIVLDDLPPPSPVAETPAKGQNDPPARAGRRRWPAPAVAAAGVLVSALVVHHDAVPDTATPTTYLVEGRVAVQVPAQWLPRRVTGGPGSARVEVVSPADPQLILHVTQAPAAGDTLADIAEPLQRALRLAETETPGVFVEFDPQGHSAGRPAVTYREIRPGHQIDWSVLVDGAVRIGIGCQDGPGGAGVLHPVCEQAVRSAHAVG